VSDAGPRAGRQPTTGIDSSRTRPLVRAAWEVFVGRVGRIGSTIYGTLLVLTALTASYAAERHHPWKLVELVVCAVLVFWLAYVYANAISSSIERRSHLTLPVVASIANRELGIILAAVGPILALLLGAIGVISERASIWVAIAVGIAALTAQGVRYARAAGLGRLGMAGILVLNVGLGLLVVVLKVALVH